jgi:calcium-dependent protein kinase
LSSSSSSSLLSSSGAPLSSSPGAVGPDLGESEAPHDARRIPSRRDLLAERSRTASCDCAPPYAAADAHPPPRSSSPNPNIKIGWRLDFSESYIRGKLLGQGSFGAVYLGIDLRNGQEVAIKVMPKVRGKLTRQRTCEKLLKEASILAALQDCPGAVRLLGCYEAADEVMVVTELCSGGDLQRLSDEAGALAERGAALVMYEALKVVKCCHDRGVLHGDVKPANFVLKHATRNPLRAPGDLDLLFTPWLRAIDFGCSQYVREERFGKRTGTPVYMAPEVFARDYGLEADVWSAGIMLYQLYARRFPYWETYEACRAARLEEVAALVGAGAIPLDYGPWRRMTPEGLDFVRSCLTHDHVDRMTVDEALDHAWFDAWLPSETELEAARAAAAAQQQQQGQQQVAAASVSTSSSMTAQQRLAASHEAQATMKERQRERENEAAAAAGGGGGGAGGGGSRRRRWPPWRLLVVGGVAGPLGAGARGVRVVLGRPADAAARPAPDGRRRARLRRQREQRHRRLERAAPAAAAAARPVDADARLARARLFAGRGGRRAPFVERSSGGRGHRPAPPAAAGAAAAGPAAARGGRRFRRAAAPDVGRRPRRARAAVAALVRRAGAAGRVVGGLGGRGRGAPRLHRAARGVGGHGRTRQRRKRQQAISAAAAAAAALVVSEKFCRFLFFCFVSCPGVLFFFCFFFYFCSPFACRWSRLPPAGSAGEREGAAALFLRALETRGKRERERKKH